MEFFPPVPVFPKDSPSTPSYSSCYKNLLCQTAKLWHRDRLQGLRCLLTERSIEPMRTLMVGIEAGCDVSVELFLASGTVCWFEFREDQRTGQAVEIRDWEEFPFTAEKAIAGHEDYLVCSQILANPKHESWFRRRVKAIYETHGQNSSYDRVDWRRVSQRVEQSDPYPDVEAFR